MRFDVRYEYHPAAELGDPFLFIDKYVVDVVVPADDDSYADVLAARFAVDRIDRLRVDQQEDLFQVCDSDSQGWESVSATLFGLDVDPPDLRKDFHDSEAGVLFNLVFIWNMVIRSDAKHLATYLIHHVAALFPDESAVLMWHESNDLSESELASLGFRKIAGSALLLRPNLLKTSYDPSQALQLHDEE